MNITKKIITIISLTCLSIVLLMIGAWAVTDSNFKIGGNIEYKVPIPDESEYSYLTFSYSDETESSSSARSTTNTSLTAIVIDCSSSVEEISVPKKIQHDSKVYEVTAIGDSAFSYCTSLTKIVLTNSITTIGDEAFSNCFYLEEINIPSSVTSVGIGVFSCCANLTSIIVEEGNTTYDSRNVCNAIIETQTNTLIQGCKTTVIPSDVSHIAEKAFYDLLWGYKNGILPDALESIGDYAFYSASLASITIPVTVSSIGIGAFSGCDSVTSIIVEEGNTTYDSRNACNAIVETSSKTLIQGCSTTVIPSDILNIGEEAFYGCYNLTNVIIPEGVTSIGKSAFQVCSNLATINIPSTVTAIGEDAFNACLGLEKVTIDSEIIGGLADSHSMGYLVEWAKMVYVKDGIEANYIAKKYYLVNTDLTGYKKYINENQTTEDFEFKITSENTVTLVGYIGSATEVTVPSTIEVEGKEFTVTTIGVEADSSWDGAFGHESDITSIVLPTTITSIGDYAFAYCSNLTNISIPSGILSIGRSPFSSCNKLVYNEYSNGYYLGNAENKHVILCDVIDTSVQTFDIHDDCKIIGEETFLDCASMTQISVPDGIVNIGNNSGNSSNMFYDLANLTYYEYANGYYLGNETNKYLILVDMIDDSVTEFEIHSSCKILASQSVGWSDIASIVIPENVTSIGGYSFYACAYLSTITIDSALVASNESYLKKLLPYFGYSTGGAPDTLYIKDTITDISDYVTSSDGAGFSYISTADGYKVYTRT